MEAAIADEPHEIADVDETICDKPLPPGLEEAVIERASGATWHATAKRAGVSPATIHRWRLEYPFDIMVSQVIRDTTAEGMLILSSRFKKAAQLEADYLDGEIDGESVGEGGTSYAKAQLRYSAAKGLMARVMRAWEYSEQLKGVSVQQPRRQPDQKRDARQLVADAREAKRQLQEVKPRGGK